MMFNHQHTSAMMQQNLMQDRSIDDWSAEPTPIADLNIGGISPQQQQQQRIHQQVAGLGPGSAGQAGASPGYLPRQQSLSPQQQHHTMSKPGSNTSASRSFLKMQQQTQKLQLQQQQQMQSQQQQLQQRQMQLQQQQAQQQANFGAVSNPMGNHPMPLMISQLNGNANRMPRAHSQQQLQHMQLQVPSHGGVGSVPVSFTHAPVLPVPVVHAQVAEFLYQVTRMLRDSNTHTIIEWQKGRIVVHSPPLLQEKVLGQYFRHSKFASFQRQLNYFGFRKLAGKGKMSPCSYIHDDLTDTSDISALLRIKRKTNGSAAALASASSNSLVLGKKRKNSSSRNLSSLQARLKQDMALQKLERNKKRCRDAYSLKRPVPSAIPSQVLYPQQSLSQSSGTGVSGLLKSIEQEPAMIVLSNPVSQISSVAGPGILKAETQPENVNNAAVDDEDFLLDLSATFKDFSSAYMTSQEKAGGTDYFNDSGPPSVTETQDSTEDAGSASGAPQVSDSDGSKTSESGSGNRSYGASPTLWHSCSSLVDMGNLFSSNQNLDQLPQWVAGQFQKLSNQEEYNPFVTDADIDAPLDSTSSSDDIGLSLEPTSMEDMRLTLQGSSDSSDKQEQAQKRARSMLPSFVIG